MQSENLIHIQIFTDNVSCLRDSTFWPCNFTRSQFHVYLIPCGNQNYFVSYILSSVDSIPPAPVTEWCQWTHGKVDHISILYHRLPKLRADRPTRWLADPPRCSNRNLIYTVHSLCSEATNRLAWEAVLVFFKEPEGSAACSLAARYIKVLFCVPVTCNLVAGYRCLEGTPF